MADYRITPGTLGRPCWTPDKQADYNDMMEQATVSIEGLTGVLIQDTAPAAEDRDKGWIKTSAGAPVDSLVYIYHNGIWVARNPAVPSGGDRRWVSLTDVELVTYDGGEAGTVGEASGPMWEDDPDMVGRMPIALGAVPGTDPALTLALGDTTGAGQITQTADQVGPHKHIVPVRARNDAQGDPALPVSLDYGVGKSEGTGTTPDDSATYARSYPLTSAGTLTGEYDTFTPDPMTILPPVKALRFIRRTARVYYRMA